MCPDNTHAKKQFIFPADDIHYPGQTNHDACFIPECVRQYNGEPLYILVAHWCLLQQNWVQRSQMKLGMKNRLYELLYGTRFCPDMQRTAFISPAEARKLCGTEASAEYEKTRGPLRI
ncbi:CaiF/GrlA family transcriptional regulator [Salmonella enterica subsp. diarizonae]|nr:CaiF/GrlA family transcriptional regulator [Salmonella enterica subsp. diarizonae]EEE1293723.1 CaiF/GrlA family transcriptional regulator [Salmonella enterica subsp. diarizonae]